MFDKKTLEKQLNVAKRQLRRQVRVVDTVDGQIESCITDRDAQVNLLQEEVKRRQSDIEKVQRHIGELEAKKLQENARLADIEFTIEDTEGELESLGNE